MDEPDRSDTPDTINEVADRIEIAADAESTEEAEHADLGLSRRETMIGGGLLGLLGLGMGSASAEPSGQIGTSSDSLDTLFLNKLNGPITNTTQINSLVDGNLSIDNSGNLNSQTSPWEDSDDDNLLELNGSLTGIDVSDVELGTLNGLSVESTDFASDGDALIVSGGGTALNFGSPGTPQAVITPEGQPVIEVAQESKPFIKMTANQFAEPHRIVMGHRSNNAVGPNSAVLGGGSHGYPNRVPVDSEYSVTVGGLGNVAGGNYSFAAGRRANTDGNDGAFVWADSSDNEFSATAANQVRFQAGGGFHVQGNVTHSGSLSQSSSVRYKTNIQPLPEGRPSVLELQPRQYKLKESGQTDIGLIAEEVEKILPELVTYNSGGEPDGVDYSSIGMFLAPEVSENRDRLEEVENAHKECAKTIDDLRSDLSARDARLADQADRIEQLEADNAQLTDRLTRLEGQLGTDGAVTGTTPADD